MAGHDSGTIGRALERAGQMLGVLVITTPVVGVVVRWVAFSFDRSLVDPLRLAVSASIPDLIATAIGPLGPAVVLVSWSMLMMAPGQWNRPVTELPRGRVETGFSWLPRRLVILLMIALVVFAAVELPLGVFAGVAMVAPAGVISGAMILRRGYYGVAAVVPLAVIVVVAWIVWFGLSLNLPGAVYAFEAGSGVPDGQYSQLGVRDDRLVLRSCVDGSIVELPSSEVKRVEPKNSAAPRRPNIFEAVSRGGQWQLGVGYIC